MIDKSQIQKNLYSYNRRLDSKLIMMEYLLAHCQFLLNSHGGLMASLFLAGLLGGAVHCSGMCSPFVFAQISTQNSSPETKTFHNLRGMLLLPYHMGRGTTYILLATIGAFFTAQTMRLFDAKWLPASLMIVAGLWFLKTAFPSVRLEYKFSRWLPQLGHKLGVLAQPLLSSPSPWKQYLLGIILGFLPCGMVFAAWLAATATAQPDAAALSMAAFWLGTTPSLMALGLGWHQLRKRWPEHMAAMTQGAMVCSALVLFILAGKWIG